MKFKFQSQTGFTLVELVVVVAVFSILIGLSTINFIKPQTRASLNTATALLISDLRAQQAKSMVGTTGGGSTAQQFGIFFSTNSYTLFSGSLYSVGAASNVVVPLDGMTITNTFPSSQIVFSRMSGEVSNFNTTLNQVTLTSDSDQKTLTINQIGTPFIE